MIYIYIYCYYYYRPFVVLGDHVRSQGMSVKLEAFAPILIM